jgi:hypothetical protein
LAEPAPVGKFNEATVFVLNITQRTHNIPMAIQTSIQKTTTSYSHIWVLRYRAPHGIPVETPDEWIQPPDQVLSPEQDSRYYWLIDQLISDYATSCIPIANIQLISTRSLLQLVQHRLKPFHQWLHSVTCIPVLGMLPLENSSSRQLLTLEFWPFLNKQVNA